MRHALIGPAVLASSLVSSVAAADERVASHESPPVFATLAPDGSHGSEVGGEVIAVTQTWSDLEDVLFGLRLGGTYLDPRIGAGGYAALPLVAGEAGAAIGDLELGALVRREVSPTLAIAARAGLTLPTASDGEAAFQTYVVSLVTRPADLVQTFPDNTTLRAAVTPTVRSGEVFIRAELGVDVVVAGDGTDELRPLIHGALGGGVIVDKVAATAEYQFLRWSDDYEDGYFHTVAVTLQYRSGRRAWYGGLGFPFGDELEGLQVLSVSFGLRAQL